MLLRHSAIIMSTSPAAFAAVAARGAAGAAAAHARAAGTAAAPARAPAAAPAPPTAPSAIVWYTCADLRLHDHEPLALASASFASVTPLFVFDPAHFGRARISGVPRVGAHRARFLLESVADLRRGLRARGSELVVRCGASAEVVPAVAAALGAAAVFKHAEACVEERSDERSAAAALAARAPACALRLVYGGQTMVHADDLPFALAALPDVFTQFRRAVERPAAAGGAPGPHVRPLAAPPAGALRPCRLPHDLPDPTPFPLAAAGLVAAGANVGAGRLPSLEALGAADLAPFFAALDAAPPPFLAARASAASAGAAGGAPPASSSSSLSSPAAAAPQPGTIDDEAVWALPPLADARGVMRFVGGETAALARLRAFVWGAGEGGGAQSALRTYKNTRNGLLGADYSSKFSPWLANGSLSARAAFFEVRAHEARFGANESTGWLIFELLWRDFFSFYARKFGPRLFALLGPRGAAGAGAGAGAGVGAGPEWRRDGALLDAWTCGATGWPWVDASMRELAATGFMSNRGRQNVASFLAKDLSLDWRLGAEVFEALLVDHGPAQNWVSASNSIFLHAHNSPRTHKSFN
jgi:deoxyribodipyrimidine photo-lyase